MSDKIPLIVIAGPTGIGKSDLAMKLAEKINSELVSADSRQIYLDFDIGTAKPTKDEQNRVKHHLIDFVSPLENYTVAEYKKDCEQVINKIYTSGKVPIIVGGTGLYIKTVLHNYEIPEVEPNFELRKKLYQDALEKGNNYLYQIALKIDPFATEKIHENDLFRIVRIIEVFETTGKLLSQSQKRSEELAYRAMYIGLSIDRENLYQRINFRVEKMIDSGLVEEVKKIIENYGKDLKLLDTINYREIRDFLLGKMSLSEAKELMKKNTRNFAKRQLTWFRNEPHLIWQNIESPDYLKSVFAKIEEFLAV